MSDPHVHMQIPISVGPHTVYAVAGRHARKGGYIPKNLSIYLDVRTWYNIRKVIPPGYSRYGAKVPRVQDKFGEIIYVNWQDFGTIGIDRLRRLVGIIRVALAQGKTVEVGCIGAHGRTGTVLAALIAKVENLSAVEAIQVLRKRYCHKAVETSQQEYMVCDLLNEPRAKVPSSVKRSSKTSVSTWEDKEWREWFNSLNDATYDENDEDDGWDDDLDNEDDEDFPGHWERDIITPDGRYVPGWEITNNGYAPKPPKNTEELFEAINKHLRDAGA